MRVRIGGGVAVFVAAVGLGCGTASQDLGDNADSGAHAPGDAAKSTQDGSQSHDARKDGETPDARPDTRDAPEKGTDGSPVRDAGAPGDATDALAPVSSELILFGGLSGTAALQGTWTFDGSVWRPLSPSTQPPATADANMASLGSGVLLVDENIEGGPSNGSWAFDGTSWVQLSVTNPTPIREYGAMAPLGGDVILFGGDPGGLDMQLQDTWLFNGASWAQIATSVEPPARQDAMMATLGSKVVLFGGVVSGDAGGSLFQDTWTFDGTTWTEVTVPNPPTPRFVAAMAPLGDKIVLFGGGGDQGDLQDTWTFDGTSWTQLSIATPPPARANAAMAPLGNKLVLFGGSYGPTALRLQDTWTFDGTNWTQLTTPVQPPACAGASMATLFCAGGQCPTGDGGDAGVDGGEQ